jgi:hypothetical protein
MDAFGTCDAFCRISFLGEARETSVRSLTRGREAAGSLLPTSSSMRLTLGVGAIRFQVQRNTLSPEWDEAMVFELSGCRATELELQLIDWSAEWEGVFPRLS